jgi:hypothetical protein
MVSYILCEASADERHSEMCLNCKTREKAGVKPFLIYRLKMNMFLRYQSYPFQ